MRSPEQMPSQENLPEKGANVRLVLKIIRHGERTKKGELTDYGREVTRKKAKESGIKGEDFDAVKAYGSPAGPKGPTGMQRSLETAHLYAGEIAGEQARVTRKRDILSYESLKTKSPYDHRKIYNANLPNNFEQLTDEEKVEAAKAAQSATTNHLFSLDSEEATTFKKETAGAFASLILKDQRIAGRLNSGSEVLMLAGTHGPQPEILLQEALTRKGADGQEVKGFKDIGEIGGPLNPSEAFDVEIITDEKGEPGRLRVTFDSPERPKGEMFLDRKKVEELAVFYESLHEKK